MPQTELVLRGCIVKKRTRTFWLYPNQQFARIEADLSINPKIGICKPSIGVDLGIKEFAVCSNGEVVANPKHLRKYEKQLARCQRISSWNLPAWECIVIQEEQQKQKLLPAANNQQQAADCSALVVLFGGS